MRINHVQKTFSKSPKRGTSFAKFSKDRVNFETKGVGKYTKEEWKEWNKEKKSNHSCRYTLDHQLLAWKCDPNYHNDFWKYGCGKYKQEDRKTTLDFLKEVGFVENEEEYQEASKYKIPLIMEKSESKWVTKTKVKKEK
jgi:hypothetical protein